MNKKLKHILVFLFIGLLFLGCKEDGGGGDLAEDPSYILNLPPLTDQFADYFMIGNIMNPGDVAGNGVTNKMLLHHFNVLTAENDMKPDKISPNKGSYNGNSAANSMVNGAIASGMKVVGHTLLWHSQIPAWQRSANLDDMKSYITGVVTRFKGKIYSWDVLNEAFPDGVSASGNWKTSMRGGSNGNPWFTSIGSDFVYEGFLAARLADPNAILYYNDYNTDQVGKATMIRNMVRDVNAKYKEEYPEETRLLIEGIGMQEHHNAGISASAIRATLKMFKDTLPGIKVSVSELDVLAQTWGEYSSQKEITEAGLKNRQTCTMITLKCTLNTAIS